MEPMVGIVCEYDPFHRGHARQFALIREMLPGARIVCVMSGCFTQRGMPALFSPAFRAAEALKAGANLVLELPCAFAVREAESFARGGVSVLDQLGFVTHLSFGCEAENLTPLWAAARLLEQPNEAFSEALHAALDEGKPFAAAQASAMVAGLASNRSAQPDAALFTHLLTGPNNILAVSYLRALLRLSSALLPLPVKREGDYRAEALTHAGYPSASATRKAFLAGDMSAAEAACGYPLAGTPVHRPEALDTVLLHRLRSLDTAALRSLPDCSEGLENRLRKAAREANSRAALLALLKTRRYTYARLNRLVTHALLDVSAAWLLPDATPPYARLLGFRQDSRDCLTLLKQSRIPILAKAADGNADDPFFQLDARAYDLWALGAGLPAGLMYRQPVTIV